MPRDVQVFATNETTQGTEEAVAAADVLDATRCDFTFSGPGQLERNTIRAHFDRESKMKVPAAFWGVALETLLLNCTGAGTAPELSAVLQASGFDEAVVGGTSVTYNLSTTPYAAAQKSITVRKEEGPVTDGNVWVAAGTRFGGFSLESDFESPVRMMFSGPGKYKPLVRLDTLTDADEAYDAGIPLAALKAAANSFYFHSYDVIARRWSLQCGLQANPRKSGGNAADYGYKWPAALNRTGYVSGEIEVEVVDETEFALWTKMLAATAANASVVYSDGSFDAEFILRNVQFGAPSPPSGEPLISRVPFSASRSGTSGALSIAFTATS